MTELVFVYGILLPDAHIGARLDGFKLEAFGPLTVTRSEGDFVLGGIVAADADRFRSYDWIEGYRAEDPAAGFYRRERAEVRVPDGSRHECWVYVMNEDKRLGDGTVDWFQEERRKRDLNRLGLVVAPTRHETINDPV